MALFGKSSHSLYFNGINDSVVCPQGGFTQTGHKINVDGLDARTSKHVVQDGDSVRSAFSKNQSLTNFTIEAWISPDAGGVVASKDGVFELRMGSVGAPAPASFSITLSEGITFAATSKHNYPTNAASFIVTGSDINTSQRELYHLCGIFSGSQIKLYINGEIIASEKLNGEYRVAVNENDLYIGGKGGEYRGYIESIHWQKGVKATDLRPLPFMKTGSTIGLWRFEEPVETDSNTYHIKSAVVANATTLTLDTTQVQTLYQSISGKSDTFSGTYTPETLGNYRIVNSAHSGGKQIINVAHRQINLIINPTGTDINTGIANSKAPERVRLVSIQSAGTITIESTHLDFTTSTDTGSRGVLHARTAYDATNHLAHDSTVVVIRSDLLIDSQSGKPHQIEGTGSQAIDRNGAMVIDESGNNFHGFLYSRQCSVNEAGNPFTVSSANWTVGDNFKRAHSGRHKYNHVEGHSFLRMLPPTSHEVIKRTIDGVADSLRATFPAAHMGIKEQLPINSQISMANVAFKGAIRNMTTSATTTHVVRNGMSSMSVPDLTQDGVIAIGVDDIRPFLLKGHGYENVETDDETHNLHLIPEDESRVAIMQVPGISSVPYVEIHYNAIDLTGAKMGINKPCLLVEKTVPSANTVLNSQTVAHHITAAIGQTLHSAGGIVTFHKEVVGEAQNAMKSHRLVGDNTGGTEKEIQLDYSKTPPLYTPLTSTDEPRGAPVSMVSALEDPSHPSVYHRLILHPNGRAQSDPPINTSPAHYQEQTLFASQQGAAYEVFDIIDNFKVNDDYHIIVQPTQKYRSMQLARVITSTVDSEDHTYASVEFIQGQGRISSFQIVEKKGSREVVLRARGLMSDLSDQTSSYTGDGSPDSHGVKEIMPGAPVVSVTLGGAGQGAINTKPSWDPSPLSRVGWNTRKSCAVKITNIVSGAWPYQRTATIEVAPINNESANLASWGTYCFPPTGKVYLENGAYGLYASRTGTTFTFDLGANAYAVQYNNEPYFKNANGQASDSFNDWKLINNLSIGDVIRLDDEFSSRSICDDGTTVNDRLFQSIGSIAHDYQLGTQYSSTRALVEIPLFPQQFFEDRANSIFPGPDNSMKLHLDPTMTAHTWSPSPVGRRAGNKNAIDVEAVGPYYNRWYNDEPLRVEVSLVKPILVSATTGYYLYLKTGHIARVPQSSLTASGDLAGMNAQNWLRKVYLDNGEWCYYVIDDSGARTDTVLNRIELLTFPSHHSENFFQDIRNGSSLTIGNLPFNVFKPLTSDNSQGTHTSANEYRNPFHYDRANTQTQGGNLDYGLRQYVSAVEFKAGPLANPHIARIESGVTKIKILEITAGSPTVCHFENINGVLPQGDLGLYDRFKYVNITTGDVGTILYNSSTQVNLISVYYASIAPAVGDLIEITSITSTGSALPTDVQDGCVNQTWNHPYCAGGLRYGDTVWMNMHYTNPHAIEGLFAKSRGVMNEYQVWKKFNGGKGVLGIQARDSLPLENFLIGNSCIETAKNFVQHVNKTIELNWTDLGHTSKSPVVAYLDPYLSTEQHARVLLYDVSHDREFISFHDLQMQVQSSAATPIINELDVAAGFATQRKDLIPNRNVGVATSIGGTSYSLSNEQGQSQFVEGAYAHAAWYLMDEGYKVTSGAGNLQYSRPSRQTSHIVKTASVSSVEHDRLEPSVLDDDAAQLRHAQNMLKTPSALIIAASASAYKFTSRFFDTPDGTRVIPAFLCMKGKRSNDLSLTTHYEASLQNLPQWYAMDFTRRLTIDFGEIGIKDGVTDIEAAANEIVRLVNQAGAANGRSSQRRPSDQYPGEGERFDINRRAVSASGENTSEPSDPTSAHHHADFATTGSTHDPAPFWDKTAFTSYDRGSHMGYMRAHIGRVIEDVNGNEGYTIVIHSTVPGAAGRNFCVWLDNSKGQTEYKPQFLIGHGGHFRNFYCAQPEIAGENMHPAPMPIDKNGKPFAPITTLREHVPIDKADGDIKNSQNIGYDSNLNTNTVPTVNSEDQSTPNSEATTGRNSNSINMESFEEEGQKYTVREGLQKGTTASARINFGGIVAAGIPGFVPSAGKWGFAENNSETNNRYLKIYGQNLESSDALYKTYSAYVPIADVGTDNIGVGTDLYGLKLTDHLGKNHIIRYVYCEEGQSYENVNVPMPPTIDEEIVIHFDDRDVSQGGFTLGDRMWGAGGSGTPIATRHGTSPKSWKGNTFRGVHAPNNGYSVTVSNKSILTVGTIATLAAVTTPGATYSAGTYNLIMQPRIGGAVGVNGTVTVTVSGGGVNAVTALVGGTGYAVGDVLTIDSGDFNATVTVDTLTTAGADYAYINSLILKQQSGCGIDNTGIWHKLPKPVASLASEGNDVLGWLGFPDSGLLWMAIESGAHTATNTCTGPSGITFHYTHRTHNNKDGEHAFYGLSGTFASNLRGYLANATMMGPDAANPTFTPVAISPYLNQTTLITDELIAAATKAAFDFAGEAGEVIPFDCSEMFAPDGRTYADWMGEKAENAIKIKAYNPKKELRSLSELFTVEVKQDWSILASSVEETPSASTVSAPGANAHMGGLTRAEINTGMNFDAGYLPNTIMQITTRYRGYNANTATPVVVDNKNNPIDVSEWRKHLRGDIFTMNKGDHITPSFHNIPIKMNHPTGRPIIRATSGGTVGGGSNWEEGEDYPTHTLTGSGSGARHSVLTDWRGPRLIDSLSDAGSGYSPGDTYAIYDNTYRVGAGAITKYELENTASSLGYVGYGSMAIAPVITAGGSQYINGYYDIQALTGNGVGGKVNVLCASPYSAIGSVSFTAGTDLGGYGYQHGDTVKVVGGNNDAVLTISTPGTGSSVSINTYSLVSEGSAVSLGSGASAKVNVDIDNTNGNVIGIQSLTGGSGYAIGQRFLLQGIGSSNDVVLTVTGVNAGVGSGYVASTDYELRVSGVKKGVARFTVDSAGAITGMDLPLVEDVLYGLAAGQDLDVFDHTGAGGSGGIVQVATVQSAVFTVKIIEGIVRNSELSYRWVGDDFLLGPKGRLKSFGINRLDAGYDPLYASHGSSFSNELGWITPTKLYLTDKHSLLVHPVEDYHCFLGAETSENIEQVWSRTIVTSWARRSNNATDLTTKGIDDKTLRLYAERYAQTHESFSGRRLSGSTYGEPLTYFRGAHDSVDHSVPLYFGGGFSGLTMDINDGSRVDYTSHNKHPYASGPTGCAGMQNIGENMGSYALLDTTAMMAMFPGTMMSDQMRGSATPPFFNQDALLSLDMSVGATAHAIPSRTYTNVRVVKPTPIVLRFAHPYARYTDSVNSVAYVIFGPGQAAPKHWKGESQSMSTSTEPSAKWTVAAQHYMTRNGSTVDYHISTEHSLGLPNELSNTILDGGANEFLPKTTAYNAKDIAPSGTFPHWETPLGAANTNFNQTAANHALNVSNHFGSVSTLDTAANIYAHPYSHYQAALRYTSAGISLDPQRSNKMIFQLDGGYAPGGNWFDDTVRKNPPHPTTGAIIAASQTATVNSVVITTGLNATMFRVGSQLATDYDKDADESTPPTDTFLIDATRCQNSEELGAVIAAAINTWPGAANLKAIGGSFLPSFQDAQRQDRYGWVKMLALSAYDATNGIVTCANQIPDTMPANGWIRVSNKPSGTDVFYGYYAHRTQTQFILGANYRSGLNVLEDPTKSTAVGGVAHGVAVVSASSSYQVYVWSKTGNLRWDNGFQEDAITLRSTTATSATSATNSAYDHFAATQVHFSGVVDAVDRTRAIGAVGWHGERYSYLNSLSIADGGAKVAAGLGAWLPASGFNPYGPSQSCHTVNSMKFTIVPAAAGLEQSAYNIVPVVDSHPAVSGTHQRHYVAISYEGDLPIIAKAAREGQVTCGDMLSLKWSAGTMGGTAISYHNERFNNDRYNAESNAGPHVEALYDNQMALSASGVTQSGASAADGSTLFQMETCLFPTGDLFHNSDFNPGVRNYSQGGDSENLFDNKPLLSSSKGYTSYGDHLAGVSDYWKGRSAGRNFFTEHVVWKRMGGGNLSLPAPNARGLGAIPWQYHKVGSEYLKFGETIYGNTRFTFETTNNAMFPIIQAQELATPSLAEQFPYEVRNALAIPNEETQFEDIAVVDDTGQEHTLAGGSPLGVVIRDYKLIQDRATEGLAPALANSGVEPNMRIQLPNHDEIPSNIIVRSGFDRLQAYQHETMGDGGLQHPAQPSTTVTNAFSNDGTIAYTAPYWEQIGYEHIDNNPNLFPDSANAILDENILKTSYEPHDRALYFHITKMGYTYTEREPLGIVANVMAHNPLTATTIGTDYISVSGAITASIWQQNATPDGRCFIVMNGSVASFTGVATSPDNRFTGVVFTPDFAGVVGDVIKPSYYIPAGTTRHFAARRLRDHAEVSGNSPDKPLTNWMGVASGATPAAAVRAANKLTPMPLPRMGHHYVTPTMSVMPGHLAHPVYQVISQKSYACAGATASDEYQKGWASVVESPDTLVWFSGVTASNPPSDIHGDGFTLMTETKIRFDGYGIASDDDVNETGGHRIRLEKGTNYNTAWHFPDPMEVGAYQIVIQPNLFSQQLIGNNDNTPYDSTVAPVNTAGAAVTTKSILTDQQIATVVALQWKTDRFDLILSEATMADVRGCEIYLNELMLDVDPSTREQFTNLPLLGLHNPFGINASTSGAFTRRSLPYHPNMFKRSTPGIPVTVPWWAVAYDQATVFAGNKWMQTSYYHPDDYYLFCRSTLGGVGCQLTMTGYPSHYLDVYTEYLASLTPTCTIMSLDATGGAGAYKIYTTNNALFPLAGLDYKQHKLAIEGTDGVIHYFSYTDRGYSSNDAAGSNTTVFTLSGTPSAFSWGKLTSGQTVRLTGPSATLLAGEVYTDSRKSVATRNLPQLLTGTRDTNSSNPPDAYLCLWHYNLGRPMTWFSDSRTNMGDAAADEAPYNHLPEHFETVHYHNFVYAMSDGPFKFRMRGWGGPGEGLVNDWDTANYPHQAGVDAMSSPRQYHYGSFWPGGHRFGAQMSDLTLYGTASVGWGAKDGTIQYDTGTSALADKGLQIAETAPTGITDDITSIPTKRRVGMGYRVSVRQPYNRPRWAIKSGQGLRDPYAAYHYNIDGPFVSNETVTSYDFTEKNTGTHTRDATEKSSSYTGILERHTNASALIGSDLKGQQVRYSHGRRMTKSYGCAVRNIINPTTAFRLFHADTPAGLEGSDVSSQRVSLALAQAHYMVDWWGNTTGEEVRRLPVRGFGVRPSWDPEDAYNRTDRTKSAEPMIAQRGTTVGAALAIVDFYDPATAKRVGDRGDGRGVRWPTVFNEDLLQSVDTNIQLSGMVLSHHTAEPPFTTGYVRPLNIALQNYEVAPGISSRLDIAGDEGLLKPAAMVGSNTSSIESSFLPANQSIQEPVSRDAPRIGIDAEVIGETEKTYAIIGTEALSLHTDRAVGQRFILEGGINTSDKSLSDYDLTALDLRTTKQVMRFGHTHGVPVMGGTFILEVSSYITPFSDLGWGRSGTGVSSNPYQTTGNAPLSVATAKDKSIKFLVRPVRVLDHKHVEMFRIAKNEYLSSTAAGRYGLFVYDTPSARAAEGTSTYLKNTNPSPTNTPYAPAYIFDASSKYEPISKGPKIPGSKSITFVSDDIRQVVARMIVSTNTLQHYRGDASRKQSTSTSDEKFVRHNFSVQPRFTQSLYAGFNQNKTTHTQGDRTDNSLLS